tara:strand:+ start:4411 stop:6681 length:2271 start_codon:yes stop_codon:yes gene_type:complete
MSLENLFSSVHNLLTGGQDQSTPEEEQQSGGLMSSSLRPRARPEGVSRSLRPRARPPGLSPITANQDDNNDVENPNEFLGRTIASMKDDRFNDDDDSPKAKPAGTTLNSTQAQEVIADPSTLFSVYNTSMAAGGANFTVAKQKPKSDAVTETIDYAEKLAQNTMLTLARTEKLPPAQVGDPGYVAGTASIGALGEPFDVEYDTTSIQQNLVDKGYKIAVDGIIGPQTNKAIKDFQKKAGIKEDGVGAQTAKALGFESSSSDVTTEVMTSPVPGPDQMGVGFQDPDIVDPTTGRPYTPEALMRREKRLVASADASVAADAKEAEKVRNPEAIPFMAASASDAERFQFPVVIGESDKDTKSGRIAIQRALNELGYDVGKEDGIIGNRSKAAIIQFQKDNTLTPDAVVGKRTAEAINKARKVTMGETATNVPTVPEETLKEASSRNLVDKAIEHGHIVGTIRDFLTDPSLKGLDFLSAYKRYGGYTSKLSELDPEGAAIVSQMGVNATGGKFNAAKDAWCALYIDGLLNLAGAERIGEGETAGQKKWKRLSALAYKNHGSSVTGAAPTQEEFNESAMRGDIIVIHSSFKITAKGNNVFYDAGGNVVLDKKGKPAKEHWISFKDMQKNEDGSYSYKPLDSISESINRLGRKQGLMLPKGRRETTKIMSEEISRYNGKGFTVQNQYHVGVNVGDAEDGFLKVLGGNQEDRVSVRTRAYPMESLVATRRVTYKDITPEFNKRLAVNDPAFSSAKKALKGLFN